MGGFHAVMRDGDEAYSLNPFFIRSKFGTKKTEAVREAMLNFTEEVSIPSSSGLGLELKGSQQN